MLVERGEIFRMLRPYEWFYLKFCIPKGMKMRLVWSS